MTATVSKAGPYYTSGEIKFSSLRSNFVLQNRKQTSGGSEDFITPTGLLRRIRASDLRRDTNTSTAYPNVPDATENANITTGSNWKASQFRNSIKFYYITQSGTDLNFDIDAQSWNNNLNKNVEKFLFVNGTCGSNNPSVPAAQLSTTTVNNLTLDVYGSILGSAGLPGGWDLTYPINGGSGGDALEMTFTSGSNNTVLVRTGARIYSGGGGGGKGANGADGTGGLCTTENIRQYCAESPNSGCNAGVYQYTRRPGCCVSTMGGGCVQSVYQNVCYVYTPTSGGTGGAGGMGGIGRGYNNQLNSLTGYAGSSGTVGGGCGATNGQQGYQGGDGGDWGSVGLAGYWSGSPPIPPSSGGSGGRAIFRSGAGASYIVSGIINTDTIKGSYIS